MSCLAVFGSKALRFAVAAAAAAAVAVRLRVVGLVWRVVLCRGLPGQDEAQSGPGGPDGGHQEDVAAGAAGSAELPERG